MSTSNLDYFLGRALVTQITVVSGIMIGFAVCQYIGLFSLHGLNGRRLVIISSLAGILLLAHFGLVDAFLTGELDKKRNTCLSAIALALMGCATATTDGYFVSSFFSFSRTIPRRIQRLLRSLVWITATTILANTVFSIIAATEMLLDNQTSAKAFIVATHSASMATDFLCGMMAHVIISQLEEASMEMVQRYLKQQKYLIIVTRAFTVCLSCGVITTTAASKTEIGRIIELFIVPSRVIAMYGILNRRRWRHQSTDCEVHFVPSGDAFNFEDIDLNEFRDKSETEEMKE